MERAAYRLFCSEGATAVGDEKRMCVHVSRRLWVMGGLLVHGPSSSSTAGRGKARKQMREALGLRHNSSRLSCSKSPVAPASRPGRPCHPCTWPTLPPLADPVIRASTPILPALRTLRLNMLASCSENTWNMLGVEFVKVSCYNFAFRLRPCQVVDHCNRSSADACSVHQCMACAGYTCSPGRAKRQCWSTGGEQTCIRRVVQRLLRDRKFEGN